MRDGAVQFPLMSTKQTVGLFLATNKRHMTYRASRVLETQLCELWVF
jgi:hypothetical protein